MDERRQFPRFPVVNPVLCSSNGKQMIGRTLNISLGGMKLEADFNLGVGESMDVAILTNNTGIHCRGRIIGIEEFGNKVFARLRFESLSDADYGKLCSFLQTLYWGRFQKWVIGGIFIALACIACLTFSN